MSLKLVIFPHSKSHTLTAHHLLTKQTSIFDLQLELVPHDF